MKIKLNRKQVNLLICLIILFVFGFWFLNVYEDRKKDLYSDVFIFFTEAMQMDIKQNLDRQMGYYDTNLSPSNISEDEINKCLDQSYVTLCDSSRHVLDSIYRAILKENGIWVKSAIRYIGEGKVINTSADSSIYKESNLLPPITYRVDDNAEKNITLQAYVDISFWTILGRMGWFLLFWFLFLIMAGVGVWYSQRMVNYTKLRMSKLFNLLRLAHNDSVQKAEEIKRKETELIELQDINSQKLLQAESINREQEELIKQKEAELNNYKEDISTKLHESESTNREQEEIIKQKESELVKLKEESTNELQQTKATNQEQLELIKQKEAEIAELKKKLVSMRTTNKTTWIYLTCDLVFNIKCGELLYKDQQSVFLTGNLYRLFCCFIKSERFEVTNEDICIEVLGRSMKDGITRSDSTTVSTNVSRLKIALEPFPFIKIDSIRKIGYKMYFTDYQNDITLQGKSD